MTNAAGKNAALKVQIVTLNQILPSTMRFDPNKHAHDCSLKTLTF